MSKTIVVVDTSNGRINQKTYQSQAKTLGEFLKEHGLDIDLQSKSVYSECGQRNLTSLDDQLADEEVSKLYISKNKMISSGC